MMEVFKDRWQAQEFLILNRVDMHFESQLFHFAVNHAS